jgi:outer membrane biosynthesis protein TonB
MKPLQIGLLVLVGALGGALIMWYTQRAKPAVAPIASVAPTPAPAPLAVVPAPTAAGTALVPESPGPKATAATVVQMGHHTQPMLRTPPVAAVAQSVPPAQPEPPIPTPLPVQEPAAPPIAVEPAPNAAPAPAPEPVEPPAPQPAPSVTLQAGMTLPVRLGESLSSEHNQAGDTFTATLDAPVTAGGFVIAEKGARVEGRVVEAQKSGHGKKATLTLELTKLDTSDGQHVAIKTETLRKQGSSTATEDQVGIVAAAAGVGAIIGALAGGGKGAAIGAGAGGAAGGGGVVATRDKAVSLPTETKVSFRLSAPVTITEQLK